MSETELVRVNFFKFWKLILMKSKCIFFFLKFCKDVVVVVFILSQKSPKEVWNFAGHSLYKPWKLWVWASCDWQCAGLVSEFWDRESVPVWCDEQDLHRHRQFPSGHAMLWAMLWYDWCRHGHVWHLRVSLLGLASLLKKEEKQTNGWNT